jgi:hypothetical protein
MRAKYFAYIVLAIVFQAIAIFSIFYFDISSNWGNNIISLSALFLPFVAYLLACYHAFARWSRAKRLIIFAPSAIVVAAVGWFFFSLLWFSMSFGGWPWEYSLPSEKQVRDRFESHQADYFRLVALLQKDPSLANTDSGGITDTSGPHAQVVAEYKGLIHKIRTKFVTLREDGSIEFALAGYGSAISSDCDMGVRYSPKDHRGNVSAEWTQTIVTSLDGAKLPQENGDVATGLYVIPIQPEWFVYRLEIQD